MINLIDFFYGDDDVGKMSNMITDRIWISHNDLDGYGCMTVGNVMIRLSITNLKRRTSYNRLHNVGVPNEVISVLKEYDPKVKMFLITDLRINRETIDYMINNGYRFIVIDHHIWSEDDYNTVMEYSPYSVISQNESATKLLYDAFCSAVSEHFGKDVSYSELDNYATAVSKYDRGYWGDWGRINGLNKCSQALMEQLIFSDFKSKDSCWLYPISMGRYIYDHKGTVHTHDEATKARFKEIVNKAFDRIYDQYEIVKKNLMVTDLYNKSLLVPFTVPFISVIAKKILEDNPKFNYLFYISPEHKMIGIRSSIDHPELNCQEIATKYGGGGHPRAAGFNLTSLDLYVSGGNAAFRFTPVDKDTIN